MATITMSVLGLYNYDQTLFENLNLPDGVDPDDVINNILLECSELEALYTSPSFMKSVIGIWSAKELPTWQRIYDCSIAEFNPIENYDRFEDSTETNNGSRQHTGTDTSGTTLHSANTGTDTVAGQSLNTAGGTDTVTHKVAGYDSETTETAAEDENAYGRTDTESHSDTTTYGAINDQHGTQSFTHGHTETDNGAMHRVSHIHGNIGVTTASQMLKEVIELAPDLNVVSYIVKSFRDRFCLLVW